MMRGTERRFSPALTAVWAPAARAAAAASTAAAVVLLLCIATAAIASPPAVSTPPEDKPDGTLGVVYADGRRTEEIGLYRLEEGSDELFLSAYHLARVFKATKYWNPGARKLELRIGMHRYLFTIDTRVVLIDGDPVLMRIPVKYDRGSVMIPLEFISGVLAPTSREKIDLDDERLVLTVGSPQYNITAIGFEEGEGGTRAVLTLTEELLYHVDSETPGLLRLKIYGGSLNPLKFTIPEEHGLFNRVRAEQTEHDAYLFFDVKRTAARFRVEFEAAGAGAAGERSAGEETSGAGAGRERRLVIFLERGELPEIPEVDYAGKRMLEILDEGPGARRREPLQRIAIDPGHGGIDNGKVGGSGIMEKDVNLEIALLLREQLTEALGVDVVMTRTEDELVPLERRAEIANTEKADLFISIHCNGWFHPDAGGFETFFLSPPRTEDETRLAREENASIRFENPALSSDTADDLDFILWDMVQNEFITESSEMAELIQQELSAVLDIRNRGVKQAGFKVLKGIKMPAVLVEVAFLSNPREEKLLQQPEFQRTVVRGIVEGIRRFQGRYAAVRRGG